jgi:sigma-B regulation protein RsbU (phosphoserine phosphatase)
MAAKVLIVDDEPDLELLIRQRFRREMRTGTYEFLFARNGAEALDIVRADPDIELVLSDINMPVMDGLTLLGRLRAIQPTPGLVIVSAYGDMPNIRAAMNQGASDFLTKPIDFNDFEVTIRKTVEQVRRGRAAAADRERLLTLQSDLRTAAQIQRSFLPSALPPFVARPDFAVHAAMLPAREVGGDFYDYFLLDEGRLGLVVGDVSGKGIPAALFMVVSRTLLRAAAQQEPDPGACLAQVNRQLLDSSSAALFVTLFYAVLEAATGELRYSNGGHTPPLLLRPGEAPQVLPGRGFVVGALEEANYETKQIRLAPGAGLFLYSDGVTEARNGSGDLFGAERLRLALEQAGDAEPEKLVRAVLEAVHGFVSGAVPSDDVTALALRFQGEREGAP